MTTLAGHPGLRRLARLELRAGLRRRLRRLKKPSGIFFAFVGAAIATGWLWAVVFGQDASGAEPLEGPLLLPLVQVGLLVLVVVTLLSALNARGMYLPKGHVERLLAAPVSRADLLRFRLRTDLVRSLLGALIFGFLALRRLPSAGYGFAGVVLAVLSLTIVRQFAAVLLVALDGPRSKRLRGGGQVALRILMALLIWGFVWVLIAGDDLLGGLEEAGSPAALLEPVLSHPVTRAVMAPSLPWARAVTATSLAELLRWGSLCLLFGVALFEITARLPIDLRQATLDTSADVAKRLSSLRKGGGPLSSFGASRGSVGGRVPWLFGRGPFGAAAWAQAVAIRRKARGALLVSLLVVGMVTVFASVTVRGSGPQAALGGAAIVALGGTVYLASGLRFDFRSSLDRMEVIKSWPLRPSRLFLATLLPEIALVSLVLAAAVLVRALLTDSFHPVVLFVLVALPPVVTSWIALDNAVFLFAPVRFVPGQEGALHHMGRTMVLVLMRLVLFGCISLIVGAGGWLIAYVGLSVLELPHAQVYAVAGVFGLSVLIAVDLALLSAGGHFLRRFDVSREVG